MSFEPHTNPYFLIMPPLGMMVYYLYFECSLAIAIFISMEPEAGLINYLRRCFWMGKHVARDSSCRNAVLVRPF